MSTIILNTYIQELSPDEVTQLHQTLDTVMERLGESLNIELVGRWIWISGETKERAEELKELGFRFASNKKAWHWELERDRHLRSRRRLTLDNLREEKGSQKIKKASGKALKK
jgi:hypothetical protein